MNTIKELVALIKENPSALLCAACMTATWYIYQDVIGIVEKQQEALLQIATTQQNIAVELREINTRLAELEHRN